MMPNGAFLVTIHQCGLVPLNIATVLQVLFFFNYI